MQEIAGQHPLRFSDQQLRAQHCQDREGDDLMPFPPIHDRADPHLRRALQILHKAEKPIEDGGAQEHQRAHRFLCDLEFVRLGRDEGLGVKNYPKYSGEALLPVVIIGEDYRKNASDHG